MNEMKRFEILEALPTYGPMYISVTETGEPFYSDGVAIRFYKSDGTSWVANFQPGCTDLIEVHEFKDEERLLVIARATCYMMNLNQTKPLSVFGVGYTMVLRTNDRRFVLQDQTDLTIIETNGEHWHSERISWDGLKDLRLENNLVVGLSYDPMNDADEWVPFTFDIDTRTLTGGSYKRYDVKKRPWWKIW